MNNFDYNDIDKSMDIISENSSLTGKFYFGDLTRIEGSTDGEIESLGTLIIGEKAKINANIYGNEVIVDGLLNGNIIAKTKIVIGHNAVITGNIKTPKLNIKNGGIINGEIIMLETIKSTNKVV